MAATTLVHRLGSGASVALLALGRACLVAVRTARALRRLNRHELTRALVHFGYDSLPLTLLVAAVVGTTSILQTSIYVQRFGARGLLGWAGGYAVIWEFGPLLLGLVLAARVGARNAAELATLQVGGQLEALAGVSLDPYALLLAPRMVAIVLASLALGAITFLVAILLQAASAQAVLGIPSGAFFQSVRGMLGDGDLAAGLLKTCAFALAMALISCTAGLSAQGGARAVGEASSAAVVHSAGAIFLLDFLLTPLLDRVLA